MLQTHLGDIHMKLLELKETAAFFSFIEKDRAYFENWIPFVSKTTTIDETRQLIMRFLEAFKQGTGYFYGLSDGGKIVGLVLIKDIDTALGSAEIGYMLSKEYCGRKIVKAACDILIKFIFNELTLEKIRICCDEQNSRSRLFPEKYGFTLEGIIRNDCMINGSVRNTMYWGLLKKEWRN